MKRFSRWSCVVASLAGMHMWACSEAEPPTEGEARSAERNEPTEVEMVAAMEAHYSAVILAHDALIRGDLERFKSQLASTLGQKLPPKSPDAWRPFHVQLQSAALIGSQASDLKSAAAAMASVVMACAGCHETLERGPVYPAPAPAEGEDEISTAMLRHQWASERMWEGVTGPWNNAWERGSAALAGTRVFSDLGPEARLSQETLAREDELRAIGREAQTTKAQEARAALYGRMLVTCGGCHRALGVR